MHPVANIAPANVPAQASTDGQLAALWLARFHSENTRRTYASRLAHYQKATGKPVQAQIMSDVLAYLESLSGLSAATRASATAILKSFFAFAFEIGYVSVNVARPIRKPRTPNQLAERIVDESAVLRLIHSEPNARNRAMLALAYAAGLRRSEIAGLEWRHVSRRDKGAVLTVHGKGGRTRHVLVSPGAIRELDTYAGGSADPESPVFPSRKGKGHMSPGQIWRIVKAAAERIGIDKISTHWLRHAHASHALDRGASPTLVRDTLGHASLATTSQYLHAKPGDGSGLYLAL